VLDLQGPKLRVGDLEGGAAELVAGKRFRLDLDDALGNAERAPLPHPEIFEALETGAEILLDDGKLRLRVSDCGKDYAETEVVTGGTLKNHKGVNLPGAVMNISPLTEKDRRDLRFGLDLGVDWVAMSFVQRPEDIAEGRRLVSGRAAIMAKIEKLMQERGPIAQPVWQDVITSSSKQVKGFVMHPANFIFGEELAIERSHLERDDLKSDRLQI